GHAIGTWLHDAGTGGVRCRQPRPLSIDEWRDGGRAAAGPCHGDAGSFGGLVHLEPIVVLLGWGDRDVVVLPAGGIALDPPAQEREGAQKPESSAVRLHELLQPASVEHERVLGR